MTPRGLRGFSGNEQGDATTARGSVPLVGRSGAGPRGLVIACTELTTAFIEEELKASDGNADPEVFSTARRARPARRRRDVRAETETVRACRAAHTGHDERRRQERRCLFLCARPREHHALQESEAVRKMVIAS